MIDSLRKELKAWPQYTQAILVHEGFRDVANEIITIRHDAWVQLAS